MDVCVMLVLQDTTAHCVHASKDKIQGNHIRQQWSMRHKRMHVQQQVEHCKKY